MKLKITNAADSFDMLQVVEFKYVGIQKQSKIKQLTIRAIKFKLNDDGSSAYSDEPPLEFFIKDLDAYLENDMVNGNTQRYASFVSVTDSIGSVLRDHFNIEYELT